MSPANGELHDLSRAIGALEEGVKNLKRTVDADNADAKQHRESLRAVIDSLTEALRTLTLEIAGVKAEIAAVKQDVQDMRPTVEDYERKRHEARGRAKWGLNAHKIWMAVGGSALFGALGSWIASHWR